MTPAWVTVVVAVFGPAATLSAVYLGQHLRGRGDRRREEVGAAAAFLGGVQLFAYQSSVFATERVLRHWASPWRPGPADLKEIMQARLQEIGTAHARLSLLASPGAVDRAKAVLDVCMEIGGFASRPKAANWRRALDALARTTFELKNELRADHKRTRLISPPRRQGSATTTAT